MWKAVNCAKKRLVLVNSGTWWPDLSQCRNYGVKLKTTTNAKVVPM